MKTKDFTVSENGELKKITFKEIRKQIIDLCINESACGSHTN